MALFFLSNKNKNSAPVGSRASLVTFTYNSPRLTGCKLHEGIGAFY